MNPLRPENRHLLEVLEPYVVVTEDNREFFDLSPFGHPVAADHVIDPLKQRSQVFLERLEGLDIVTFGPEGMPMPRWMFVDSAEIPGGVVGLCCPVERMPEAARALYRLPEDAEGLVPLSMFIAIPTHAPNTWMGHNLASAGPLLPAPEMGMGDRGFAGLASLTKALGLAVFRAEHQVGVTQWNSRALAVHTRLGPLELMTAWTPAHSEPWSLTYRANITEAAVRNLAREPGYEPERPAPDLMVDSEDHATMQRLQKEIEAGARYVVTGRPEILDPDHLRVPVAALN